MHHLLSTDGQRAWPLYGSQPSRVLEARALAAAAPHELMQRAGTAVYRLGRALYPHARLVWVACGPGNNGGDGLVAALAWQRQLAATGGQVTVGCWSDVERLPPDARAAYRAAQAAGVIFNDRPPANTDLVVDALFGLGVQRALTGDYAEVVQWLQHTRAPVLCVDLPSGLDPDSGRWWGSQPSPPSGPRHTLCLLTLKPGLFTGHGRDAVGDLWFDTLGVTPPDTEPPTAWLHAPAPAPDWRQPHSGHKGSRGDLVVIGGQQASAEAAGMTGAALLAARAGLHAGAGRVYLALLNVPGEAPALSVDTAQPELMFRHPLTLTELTRQASTVTVCGCGGGTAVQAVLPGLLASSPSLVLDADALNALATLTEGAALAEARRAHGWTTVLTPHPLEAARLLGCDTASVQHNRLGTAQALAERWGATVVLKGSGSVVAAPGLVPRLNPCGNGLLATAGTGDVLAGMVGAALCRLGTADADQVQQAVADAVHAHGLRADRWPTPHQPLVASDL